MSSDRHLRRIGQDYGSAFLTLLPQGQAWPKRPGSTLDLACRGLAEYWGFVDTRAADLLEIESDPRKTFELLTDWERNWGLPPQCFTQPGSLGERQKMLVMWMTLLGAQSRDWFIYVASLFGYEITISEFRPFMIGMDRCGDSRVYGDGSDPMFHENFVRGYLIVETPNGERISSSPGQITLNPASARNVTLSEDWLVATNTGTTDVDQGVQGGSPADIDAVKTTGRFYFEVEFTALASVAGSNYGCGVAAPGANYGDGAVGGAALYSDGSIYADGAVSEYSVGPRAAGDIIGVAVDLNSLRVWFTVVGSGLWNGDADADPTKNINGAELPFGAMVPTLLFGGPGGVANDVQTANFGATAFAGEAPVGFDGGWPTEIGELSEWPNYGIGPPEMRFYWTVHVHKTALTWFRTGGGGGQTGIDPHLRIGVAEDLECILNLWKPAHTEIIFDYSGLQPSDPMAGTP